MQIKEKTQETSLVAPVTLEFIERRIHLIRGQKAMLDSDLAELYQVTTGNLNLAVKRNSTRFPIDFMFQLTRKENENLLLQSAIPRWGGRHTLPNAFTELGVAMLSSVLNSDKAVQMNISIMRAFIKLREMISTHADLAKKIEELEKGQDYHGKRISAISAVLKQMIADQTHPKSAIGFQINTGR
jgi:hypothetical protein